MPEPAFKKHSVFLGASGSGKTELSVNFAILARRRAGRRVIFIDMDQTKGLFRARDFFDELRAEGVEPVDTFAFQDAPVIPAGVAAAIDDEDAMCVFDVGGNAAGAVMIGQFVEKLPVESTDYFFVINPCRPLSATAAGLERGMVELGAVGLPVFSSFSGGLGKLAGPTGGYLIGFIFLALIQGFLMKCFPGKTAAAVAGMVLGMAVCYLLGTAWLAFQMELTFPAALAAGVLPYLPGDGIKIAIAAAAGPKLVSAIQRNSGLPY